MEIFWQEPSETDTGQVDIYLYRENEACPLAEFEFSAIENLKLFCHESIEIFYLFILC